MAAGTADSVLVIAAESTSTMVNPADSATAPIFGDGAGAVVLRRARPGQAATLGPAIWGSDGTLADAIAIPAGGVRKRAAANSAGASALDSPSREGRSVRPRRRS